MLYVHMEVQNAHLPKPIPEAITVLIQANLPAELLNMPSLEN